MVVVYILFCLLNSVTKSNISNVYSVLNHLCPYRIVDILIATNTERGIAPGR